MTRSPSPRSQDVAGRPGRRLCPLVVGCLSLAVLACTDAPKATPNVVVVLVDTLRADSLHVYGHPRPTTPRFDDFAASSLVFENHRAQAPCTFPSVNSLLTSRYTAHFTASEKLYLGIPDHLPTLAQILKRRGYSTLALSASPIVRDTPTVNGNPDGGFGAGFDRFLEACQWREAQCLNDTLETELETLEAPFFVYLHYIDPHDPYSAPHPYRDLYASRDPGASDWARRGDPNPLAAMIYADGEEIAYSPQDLATLKARYEEEVSYVDAQFGHLLDLLAQRALLQDAIVVLLSDHGESFLENDHVKHCHSLLDTEIRTPFLLQLPGRAHRRFDAVTQNLDVVPTLLDYLEIDTSGESFDGVSLRPLIEEGKPVNRAGFAAMDFYRSVVDERFKLMIDLRSETSVLHDYRRDPGESTDLQQRDRRHSHRLQSWLLEWIAENDPQATRMLGDVGAVQERLRSLGYLQ